MKNKKVKFIACLVFIIFLSTIAYAREDRIKIKIKGDWFYVNGERFLVKGVAYSPWRPGQLPWGVRPIRQKMEEDFRMIKEAGFNTIRTWSPLTEEELLLAKKYGLMVIQGIWVDPVADPLYSFRDPNVTKRISNIVAKETRRFKDYDNILMFLIGNEIPVESVVKSGKEETGKMLMAIKNTVKEIDSKRYVSYANWSQLAFLDHSFWDVVCFNVYNYHPVTVSHSLGFGGFIRWLKQSIAAKKPLIITEYGLSVSREGEGKWGYGGNSLEEQKEGSLYLWNTIINSGATGGCIFEWNDEWWKNYDEKQDEDSHDDQPEEWFGILGIEGVKDKYVEKLRPIYLAMKEYNQAIITEPKSIGFYKRKIKIEIYSSDGVYKIEYKINENEWQECEKVSPHWWQGKWDSSRFVDDRQVLRIKAYDNNHNLLCEKEKYFWTKKYPEAVRRCLNVKIAIKSEKILVGETPETVKIIFKVTDGKGNPVAQKEMDYAFYETVYWQEAQGRKITNEKGEVEIDYIVKEPGFIAVSSGVDLDGINGYRERFGSIRFVEIVKKN